MNMKHAFYLLLVTANLIAMDSEESQEQAEESQKETIQKSIDAHKTIAYHHEHNSTSFMYLYSLMDSSINTNKTAYMKAIGTSRFQCAAWLRNTETDEVMYIKNPTKTFIELRDLFKNTPEESSSEQQSSSSTPDNPKPENKSKENK